MPKTTEKDIETFYPKNQLEWRKWLEENHDVKQSIWLLCYKTKTGKPTITWSDAVDEALCFGWIDSTRKSIDANAFIQFFSKRKAKGTWSKINKEKIGKLIANGKMTKAGLDCIEKAKHNGSWTILDEVEELIIPAELEKEFENWEGSKEYFMGLSKSVRKMSLHRIVMAKQAETRQKRAKEIVEQIVHKLNENSLNTSVT